MAANNLRIASANRVTAVGGSWTGTANNVLNDYRSQFATTAAGTFTVTIGTAFASGTKIAVIVVLTDNTNSISMSVSATNFSASSNLSSSATNITTANTSGRGGGQYLAAYGTSIGTTGTIFTITVPVGTKISRVIIGEYWAPRYNTSFGLQTGFADSSTSERTQSGDLYTIYGTRNKTLNLNLDYLDESDKFKFYDILKANGKMIPIFVSAFPADTDVDKEQMFSIYGKFTDLTTLTHSMWTVYTSSISLEEI